MYDTLPHRCGGICDPVQRYASGENTCLVRRVAIHIGTILDTVLKGSRDVWNTNRSMHLHKYKNHLKR